MTHSSVWDRYFGISFYSSQCSLAVYSGEWASGAGSHLRSHICETEDDNFDIVQLFFNSGGYISDRIHDVRVQH